MKPYITPVCLEMQFCVLESYYNLLQCFYNIKLPVEIYIYVCVCVCVYVHVYLFINENVCICKAYSSGYF